MGAVAFAAVSLPGAHRAAEGACAGSGASVFPQSGTEIPVRPQIAVRAFGLDQIWVEGIAEREPALVSRDHRVPLVVVDILKGSGSLVQAVLTPQKPLRAGRTYALEVRRNRNRELFREHPRSGKPVEWRVVDRKYPPLRWRGRPQVVDQVYRELGCGPAAHVKVSAAIEGGAGPLSVIASVRRRSSEQDVTARFRLPVRDGVVELGYGMCTGAFRLQPGEKYRVTLEAVDVDGHRAPAPGQPLHFEGPGPHEPPRRPHLILRWPR